MKHREKVWKLKIGNKLSITKDVYNEALSKGTPTYRHLIEQEASTTFPELKIFDKETGPLYQDLVNVLTAYGAYRPQIGYNSGLRYIAAIFLLNMTAVDSFIAFSNMLEDSITFAIHSGDEQSVASYYASFLKVLNTKLPSLYQHFQNNRLAPSAYLGPMISSWYADYVSIDLINRLWDIFIFEGDAFLIRIGLGILLSVQYKLYGSRSEVLSLLQPGTLRITEEDKFISTVFGALKKDVR